MNEKNNASVFPLAKSLAIGIPRHQQPILIALITGLLLLFCGSEAQARPCTDSVTKTEVLPGLWIESLRPALKASVETADPCLHLLRIDLRKFKLRLLTAFVHGGAKTAPDWLDEFGLVAVTNTSMFRPSMRSTGLMRDGAKINNAKDTKKYGAFLAYGPRKKGLAQVALFGRGCPGFDIDKIQEDYRIVVQNYRILNCKGQPVRWGSDKTHSTAAVAVDSNGRLVFAHLRAPYRTRDFAKILADPRLGLKAAMYVEGGPEASLFVKANGQELQATGSYETDFMEDDSNRNFWDLPNVFGIAPRK